MTIVVPPSALSSSEHFIAKILPWVHEAGNPYFDFLFGGNAAAVSVLDRWMRRKSSEVSIARAALLHGQDEPVAGFIALSGSELNACRRVDMAALTMAGSRRQREEVLERLELVRDLFPLVKEDEFYLSKFWVDGRHRGAGHARELMNSYLAAGRTQGFTRFRLDVCADNERAVRVYRSFGFKEFRETVVLEAGLRYLAMTAEVVL